MNTNTIDLNLKKQELTLDNMELITGGDFGDHFVGAVMGMGLGAISGSLAGTCVGGLGGGATGAAIGAPIGAVAGGIVGVRKICDTADSVMRKIVNLF